MSGKKKILIVEDDPLLIDMYDLRFSEAGYKVIKATNGKEGYEKAIKEKPEVILLDIILPQMDGFTVMENLQKNIQTKNIPVFFLTNLKQDEDVKRGKKLGAKGYLVKASLTPSQILEKIEEFLSKK